MEKYDYRRHIIDDIKEYITNHRELWPDPKYVDDIIEYWYDTLDNESEITGNGTPWYDTEEHCAKYVGDNIELVYKAKEKYYYSWEYSRPRIISCFEEGKLARYFDYTIRSYLLEECLKEALEEMNNESVE